MRVEVVRVRGDYVLIVTYRVSDFLDGLCWSVSPVTRCACPRSAFRHWPQRRGPLTISISLMLAYRSSGCLLSSNVDRFPPPPTASVASPQPKTPASSATPRTPFPVHAGAESPRAAEPGPVFVAVVAFPVLANLRFGFPVIGNAGEGRMLIPLQATAPRRPRAQAGGRALQVDLTDMQATGLGAAAEYHKPGL